MATLPLVLIKLTLLCIRLARTLQHQNFHPTQIVPLCKTATFINAWWWTQCSEIIKLIL
jgi:hypothetical protein